VPEDRVLPHEMYAPSATPVDILTETRPTVVKLFG
jgi:hypothetical protein